MCRYKKSIFTCRSNKVYISKGLQNFIYSAQENYSGGILLEIWKFVDVQDTSKKNIDLCKMKLRKHS